MTVVDFILENIDKTTKLNDEKSGEDTLIVLPYPFTTPCVEGMFQEMYYWDTYFTQKALYLTGRNAQALHNVKNFVFLLERYGKIPNGNRTYYLKNSQPPFFGLMLKDLMENAPNAITVEYAFEKLEKEYSFWMKNRQVKNGLNHYNRDMEDEANPDTIRWYKERTGIELENTADNCRSIWSEGESGWDFCPRFHSACTHYNAIDLNCLLYADELLLSLWAKQAGDIQAFKRYQNAAVKRKETMWKHMRGKDGIWYDYNYDENTLSKVISCASLFPFFVGLDTDTSAFEKTIAVLERAFGVVASQSERKTYQWAEPNGWAPLNYIAVAAAERLGLKETALRLAEKYLVAMEGIFEKTGRLWEKYNAETGDMSVTSEYGTPEMLGWTAGVYMALYHYRKNGYQKLI